MCHGDYSNVFNMTNITWDQAQFSFRFVITFRRARQNEAVAIIENVLEPLELGLVSGYDKHRPWIFQELFS